MTAVLTRVALVFIDRRINVYLRFGRPHHERIVDAHRRVAVFGPRAVWCRVRWQANDYGTTLWQLAVVQTATPGTPCQRVAGVQPGVKLLLHVTGARNVQGVLGLIDAIEGQGCDPVDVAPDYWLLVHHRLLARAEPPSYTLERHAAHRARRCLG